MRVLLIVPSPIYPQPDDVLEHPHIRTFHARQGRMSASREMALNTLVPNFEISELNRPIDLRKVLKTDNIIVDFGSGMGTHAIALAHNNPKIGVLAIDVHTVGLIAIAETATDLDLKNIRTHEGDGIDVIKSWLLPESVQEVHVLFPDPWPKVRHHKRRLINHSFLEMVFTVLQPGGRMIFATDDESYFAAAKIAFLKFGRFRMNFEDWDIPLTTYHQRAKRLEHKISQLSARKA